ncbi:hypothetical protein [Jeotgalibacillus soli]|uniref:Lipoprotein n=1 Tax=Jeotgalibacillus soli TaxID=889306 RepID=A0A0C2VHB3_9BACL|nr:hypothetical protein [Jeotgalibacillus soli]KIL43891.1 hypothetical protein KP78_37150 [Jeotgalibacillus soli]
MKKASLFPVFLLLCTFLFACSTTIEDEKEKTLEEVEQLFTDEPKRTNEDTEALSLRLPFGVSMVEESDHNIILEKSNATFVLFHHFNEQAGNDVIYTMTVNHVDDPWLINETFEEDDRFGYVLVRQMDEEHYELVTGINHAKITTISDLDSLSSNAKWMMETVSSVKWEDTTE